MRKRDRERLGKLDRDLGHLERQVKLLNHERKHRNRRDAEGSRTHPPRVGTYHEVWVRQRTNGPIMVQTRARPWEKGDGSWCASTSSEYPDPDPWTFATHGDAIRWLSLGGYTYVRTVVR